MKLNQKSGFTLLEVIIVVIIVAILASVAMPKISSSVTFSKAKEALGVIPTIRQAMDECYLLNNNKYTGCGADLAALGITWVPKYFNAPTITVAGTGASYTIDIVYTADAGNTINYSSATQKVTGAGAFAKLSNTF